MIVFLAMLAISPPDVAQEDAAVRRAVAASPPPVRSFVKRRATCNHWAGEDAFDAARGRQIDRAMRQLRCDRLEADEHGLRHRYAQKPSVMALIDKTRDYDGAL